MCCECGPRPAAQTHETSGAGTSLATDTPKAGGRRRITDELRGRPATMTLQRRLHHRHPLDVRQSQRIGDQRRGAGITRDDSVFNFYRSLSASAMTCQSSRTATLRRSYRKRGRLRVHATTRRPRVARPWKLHPAPPTRRHGRPQLGGRAEDHWQLPSFPSPRPRSLGADCSAPRTSMTSPGEDSDRSFPPRTGRSTRQSVEAVWSMSATRLPHGNDENR